MTIKDKFKGRHKYEMKSKLSQIIGQRQDKKHLHEIIFRIFTKSNFGKTGHLDI